MLWRAILGGMAGWMVQGSVWAQDTTQARRDSLVRAAADSARLDSMRARARQDSAEAETRRRAEQQRRADSVKAPIAHPEYPALTSVGAPNRWDRASLFATGALTLGELVDLVPGVTGFRSGWIGAPHIAAYLGAFRRIRVFYDGLEIDPLDPRMGGMLDLSFVDTWQLEEARIENGADEVRVHLGSWRVRSTTPATRVDFSTGDLETNAYRGYYGRRFQRGQAIQLGAYQYSSTDVRNGGDAHQLSLWGRVGWSNRRWSFDASLVRTARERLEQARLPPLPNLPKLDGAMSTSYVRAAYGDADSGLWAQAIAGAGRFTIHGPPLIVIDSVPGPGGGGPDGSPQNPDTISVSTDTTENRPQYVLAGGWSRGPLRVSATSRLRSDGGKTQVAPGIRAAFETPRVALALYAERATTDSLLRGDVAGRVLLLPYLALGGAVGRRAPITGQGDVTSLTVRGEVGVRVGRVWITGGVMTRDTAMTFAPVVFDTSFRSSRQGRTTAVVATLRGKAWRDVGVDATALRYAEAGSYRPQYQTRSQLYFDSGLLSRYPSGNLHIRAAVTHDYRSYAFFPISGTVLQRSSQYRTWGFLLEIRLLTATMSYQFRNFLNAEYTQVPGYLMPRPVNYYGVRWNFSN